MKTYSVTGCREMFTLHTFTIQAASELSARKKFRKKFKRGVSISGVKAVQMATPKPDTARHDCNAWPKCDCVARGNFKRDCSASFAI